MTHVFVTGATGVVGSALVPLFLSRPDVSLTLLMRRKGRAGLDERLGELARYWGMPENDASLRRISMAEGDTALPRFGLSEDRFRQLGKSVTHLVHCAGAVKMTLPIEEARAHAVIPALATLELAELCRASGQLRKVEVVSTVGVAGCTPGLISERAMPEVKAFHNTYEEAKAEAERVLFERWEDLPITIHRPSMVVGTSTAGRIIQFQVFYHLCEFLSGKRTAGVMPRLEGATLDIVPVDYVANCIFWSAFNENAAHRILHLSSGPELAVRLPDLVNRIRSRLKREDTALPPLRFLPLPVFRSVVPVMRLFVPAAVSRALGHLELFLAYLREQQSFASTQTQALVGSAGISLPQPAQYLDSVLDYYESSR